MMSDDRKKDIDDISGVETTGHEWDGLKELNNPLPRWWVWVFIACCVWSFWYFVAYPAWPVPGGATKGTTGYTQFKELKASQGEIALRQQAYIENFEKSSFAEILDDPTLYAFANAGGAAAFKENCAQCHASGAQGGKGYPNLNDDDWLWGGRVDDIYTTLQHGIRVQNDDDTRQSQMPAFGKDGLLKRKEIEQVVDYVLALSQEGGAANIGEAYTIFQENCASCHGADGKGMRDFGAPNLTDKIWLFGGTRSEVFETVYNARAGVMPAWKARLDDNTLRQLAIYVHQLGGGEADAPIIVPAIVPAPTSLPADAEAAPSTETDDAPTITPED